MNHATFLVTERQSASNDSPLHGDSGRASRSPPHTGVRDTAMVDVGNWHSMQYWAKWLGISEQQLLRATRSAGTSVAAIESHLAERRERRLRKRAGSVAFV